MVPPVTTQTAAAPGRPAVPDIVAEHLEEHAFLSLQRRKLLFSLDVPERRLALHDERIEAHWDALEVNRPDSGRIAAELLEAEDPWLLASATRAWLVFAEPAPAALLERWKELPPALAPAWREALRGLPGDALDARVPRAQRASLPAQPLALVVDALAWGGRLDGTLAAAAARHADPAVRAAAARALGPAGPEHEALLRPLLEDAEPAVRWRALWSMALLAPHSALATARPLARRGVPFPVRVLGLLGERDDHELIAASAATDEGRPAAFHAFADLGTPEAIESLVRLLALPDEALCRETTLALERAVGAIARKDADAPATVAEARIHLATLPDTGEARLLAGLPRPWQGDKADEPLAWRWRSAIMKTGPGRAWHRNEVPDGFFDALPTDVARPGE
jgi:HEAT repeat protein